MSEKHFNWCMIYWKGQWRVYRDKSAFPWGLPVICADTRVQATQRLQDYLGNDCPSFVGVYDRKIRTQDCQGAYEEFRYGPKTVFGKFRNWLGKICE